MEITPESDRVVVLVGDEHAQASCDIYLSEMQATCVGEHEQVGCDKATNVESDSESLKHFLAEWSTENDKLTVLFLCC